MRYKPIKKLEIVNQDVKEILRVSETNFEALKKIDEEAKKKGEILWRYIKLSVADGYAFYQITKVTKTSCTVEICTDICLDGYMDPLLGDKSTIPLKKAYELVHYRQTMEEIFK
jgi:uncharacterized protein YqiB (DUF1249 family)